MSFIFSFRSNKMFDDVSCFNVPATVFQAFWDNGKGIG